MTTLRAGAVFVSAGSAHVPRMQLQRTAFFGRTDAGAVQKGAGQGGLVATCSSLNFY